MDDVILKYAGWKNLYRGFTHSVKSQNYASQKDRMYISYATEFIVWCEDQDIKHIPFVKSQDVYRYMEYIRNRPNLRRGGILSDSSIRHHLQSMRMLFDYCYTSGYIDYTVPFPKFQPGKSTPKKVLGTGQIKLLFDACENKFDTAMLCLLYACGMRRSEVCKLNIDEVHTGENKLYVKEGKGRKYRTITLSDKTVQLLREYEYYHRPQLLALRKDYHSEKAFLLNQHGYRLQGNGLYLRLQFLAGKIPAAQLDDIKITPHYLRHCIATHMVERGASMEWVQNFLGHYDPDSTHIYTRQGKTHAIF